MKIFCWSDYTCPWCWIGEVRMKKALASLPELGEAEIEMKAFQLNPNAPQHAKDTTEVRIVREDGLTPEQAAERVKTVNAAARGEGLDFHYGTSLATNTMDAHRLTKLAQSKGDNGITEKVTTALFRAYFIENKELADRQTLLQIAESAGLDSTETEELLDSDRFRDDVIRDEQEAAYYGIHSVPFFVIGKYGISGAQDPQYFAAAIRQISAEMEEEETGSSGMTCGPDGC